MATINVSLSGDVIDHGGAIIGTGVKMLVGGIPVVLHGDLVYCSLHEAATVIAGQHKLTHQGIPVAAVGDMVSCGGTIVGPGAMKLKVN